MDGAARDSSLHRKIAIEIVPNCSLSPRQALFFFASISVVSLVIAGIFALQGFWPILPFAGLELGLLGWALRASMRRRHYLQTIRVSDAEVEVVTRDQRGSQEERFPRLWARVRLVRAHGWHPSRLVIESHGRTCEVGGVLTEEERRGLHGRLRGLVGSVSELPHLEAAA